MPAISRIQQLKEKYTLQDKNDIKEMNDDDKINKEYSQIRLGGPSELKDNVNLNNQSPIQPNSTMKSVNFLDDKSNKKVSAFDLKTPEKNQFISQDVALNTQQQNILKKFQESSNFNDRLTNQNLTSTLGMQSPMFRTNNQSNFGDFPNNSHIDYNNLEMEEQYKTRNMQDVLSYQKQIIVLQTDLQTKDKQVKQQEKIINDLKMKLQQTEYYLDKMNQDHKITLQQALSLRGPEFKVKLNEETVAQQKHIIELAFQNKKLQKQLDENQHVPKQIENIDIEQNHRLPRLHERNAQLDFLSRLGNVLMLSQIKQMKIDSFKEEILVKKPGFSRIGEMVSQSENSILMHSENISKELIETKAQKENLLKQLNTVNKLLVNQEQNPSQLQQMQNMYSLEIQNKDLKEKVKQLEVEKYKIKFQASNRSKSSSNADKLMQQQQMMMTGQIPTEPQDAPLFGGVISQNTYKYKVIPHEVQQIYSDSSKAQIITKSSFGQNFPIKGKLLIQILNLEDLAQTQIKDMYSSIINFFYNKKLERTTKPIKDPNYTFDETVGVDVEIYQENSIPEIKFELIRNFIEKEQQKQTSFIGRIEHVKFKEYLLQQSQNQKFQVILKQDSDQLLSAKLYINFSFYPNNN